MFFALDNTDLIILVGAYIECIDQPTKMNYIITSGKKHKNVGWHEKSKIDQAQMVMVTFRDTSSQIFSSGWL